MSEEKREPEPGDIALTAADGCTVGCGIIVFGALAMVTILFAIGAAALCTQEVF